MNSKMLFAGAIVAAFAVPVPANAQGVPGGFVRGAHEGYRVAGPIGAVVGAPVGGVIGGIEGMLGIGPSYREPPPQAVRHRVAHVTGRKSRRVHVVQ